MKPTIKVDRELFYSKIKNAVKFIPGKVIIPVMDHFMFSVKDGFLFNVDANIISHPANCELMIHSKNISKNKNSSITLDTLLKRIHEWDLKYNKYT